MPYGLLADATVAFHAAFILFACGGAALLVRWPRLLLVHLAALAWAIWIAASGSICPLTPLENRFRAAAGEGWKLTESGETAIGGRLPVNMSGGVLCSNPIGASGMLRFAEAALQVMGEAGEHQVDGARRALGHAYGGGSQFFAMWVVGAEKPTN